MKGGVNAKDLFHLYIMVWIQDKRHSLLESCKLDKVRHVLSDYKDGPLVHSLYSPLFVSI